MNVCIYPGTFDPITHGHLDVLERACRIFDRVIIAIAENRDKNPFFSGEKRLQLVNENLDRFPSATAMVFQGLLIDFAKEQSASVIIRGLRAVSDFEFEFQMANMNRHLGPEIETVLVMTKEGYNYTSSTLVKQVAEYGADVSKFVPDNVYQALKERVANR
jgi:pantetheine-phosphate adenylyltransferase